ncbi:hypothetical protein BSK55_29345 [Paenibacillus odorifer]|nr:hypothetical protein BSK55_29345 [Paenibacillus odorifer]
MSRKTPNMNLFRMNSFSGVRNLARKAINQQIASTESGSSGESNDVWLVSIESEAEEEDDDDV